MLILWADNHSANLGVRALAEGMAALARKAWGRDTVIEFQNFAAGDSDRSFWIRSILRDVGRRNGPIKEKLRSYDVVLDSGAGDSFTDIYGLTRFLVMAYTARIASQLRIPVVMGPQTIGPFRTSVGRRVAPYVLNIASQVHVRDSASGACAERLGRSADSLATDVVFLLEREFRFQTRDVILNVSGLLWSSDSQACSQRYRDQVARLVHLLEDRGRSVSLLAHVIGEDTSAVLEFAEQLGGDHEILLPKSLNEVRGILGSGALVIAARMHASLNALSSGTPAISWAYSRKFTMIQNLGWNYGLDFNTATDPCAETLKLVDSITSSGREELEATLATTSKRFVATINIMRSLDRGRINYSA